MRKQVITFLSTPEGSLEDQFNQGVLLYMKSPNVNNALLRSYNTQGFSIQRLEELKYDLKQAYLITPEDFAPVPEPKASKVNELLPEGFPNFSKGAKGNKERKDYLEAHNITSEDFTNKSMDAAIADYLKNIEVEVEVEEPEAEAETADDVAPETEKK